MKISLSISKIDGEREDNQEAFILFVSNLWRQPSISKPSVPLQSLTMSPWPGKCEFFHYHYNSCNPASVMQDFVPTFERCFTQQLII